MARNFQEELKAAQFQVKALGATREKLVGDARIEEHNVKQAIEALTALGIENAGKLTVAQLGELRDTTQADLEKNLDELKVLISQGEALVAEYNAVAA